MGKVVLLQDLDPSVTETGLQEVLGKYGTVLELSLVDDEKADPPAKTAFVTFQNGREGRAAIAGLDGFELAGRAMKAKALRGRDTQTRGSTAGLGGGLASGRGRFGGKTGTYGHKGRGKAGGRNR